MRKKYIDWNVVSVEDGYKRLLFAIEYQAMIDKKYFDNGLPPVGNCGRGPKRYNYKNLLKCDPIIEWENSLVKSLGDGYICNNIIRSNV